MRKHPYHVHLLLVVGCLVVLASCGRKPQPSGEAEYTSTANPEIVSSHVSGPISSEARIIVRFVQDIVPMTEVGAKVAQHVVILTPAASGEVVWADTRTMEFKASQPLSRGRTYTVKVYPTIIDPTRFDESSHFYFSFSIVNQSVSVDADGFAGAGTTDLYAMVFSGTLRTADVADAGAVEGLVTATLDGKKLGVQWSHAKLDHRFVLQGITKQDKPQQLRLQVSGGALDPSYQRSLEYEVPVKTAFKALASRAVESPERYVEVSFTDPLLASQDFRGFVEVSPSRNLRFAAKDSLLKVYSLSDWGDDTRVSVKRGIRNAAGEPLAEDAAFSVTFKAVRPEVRFIGSGVIVPQKAGVTVPIETVNLNAIVVEIQKIYADNIDQFLQVNELSQGGELQRVGKTIWKKIVPVPYTVERRNQWIRTALDLSPLVEDDGHSLYRITLSFDVRHIEYPGEVLSEDELLDFPMQNIEMSEPSDGTRVLSEAFWEEYGSEAAKSRPRRSGSWYENRDNPRHPAFYSGYGRSLKAARNFLVSDLAVIAQRDVNKRLTVAVSSLLTAEPVADASVTVYDYQLQMLAGAKTDSSGLASLAVQEDGFLVIAESWSGKGYLRLQGASNLPVSHFDVTGQEVQKGVKGFIYGERGVWRPGDPIYLTFVLQDKDKVLPDGHPVVLRLYDPQGKLVKSVSKKDPVGGFYHFGLGTAAEDPTGDYTVKITVGGVVFSKVLPVETVKPNRLKITVGFGAGVEELTADPVEASLGATWLHGAAAAGMDADVSVHLSSIPTSFPSYKGYVFDDPVRSFKAESKEVFKGRLDQQGAARFSLSLSAGAVAPGKLMGRFRTRVFEPGGNINADAFSMAFHPFTEYAGIRIPDAEKGSGWLDVDEPHTVQIVLVSPKGEAVSSGEVEVDVYAIGWRWWWDRNHDDIADYLGTKDYRLVSSEKVTVSTGAAEWTLRFKERVWGRYLVRVRDAKSLHATGQIVYMRWPGWYYTSSDQGGDSANVLVFQADKQSYAVGETARITVPTAEKGRALVSIENNGRLISTEWIETKAGQTMYSLRLTEAMTPNVYVHVSLVQPHGQTVNDRPIRMFGVVPLSVEDPDTRLHPRLTTADVYEPNSTVSISVSESSGKPMTYTLAIVDEGLLGLTRFTTPDPWDQFFRRDALAVSTFDTYGFVAAAYGGTLEKLLAIGGGDGGGPAEGTKANRFPPMVRFLGPFSLAQGKTVAHSVDIPQYLGAVRVMVVAGNDDAYGAADKEVPVKKPVMVYATLPRVVSVTEKFSLPASVFAMEPGITAVDVSARASGGITIVGQARATVAFEAVGDKLVSFECVAGSTPGLAVVEVTASSGRASSTQRIEIDVRVPSPPVTTVDALYLKAGEARDHALSLPGMPGTNAVVLEVSKIAPINLEQRLRFLLRYPYGCIEQTTSAAFPQLYLDKITGLDAAQAAEVQSNVQAAVDRLRQFQTHSGGFGYWPGDSAASAYATTYAAHFLLEAERLGYVVPSPLKRGVIAYLKAQVGLWAWGVDRSDLVQAYALYDLALAGEPELGAMNRMREKQNLPVEARFKLAAAYAFAGQKQEAQRLTRGSIAPFSPYSELGGTYGSALRDTALLAEGLLETGSVDEAAPLINEISKALSGDLWHSTQATAYGLLVIGKYLATWKSDAPIRVAYTLAGRREEVESSVPVKRLPLGLRSEKATESLTITNESREPIYVRILKTGQPAPGDEASYANGLSLDVRYYDKDGAALDVRSLPQGTDIVAHITVSNPTGRYYEELAMTYMVPSGWEITNPRFEGWSRDREAGFEYQDIRDDRVTTFFGLGGSRNKSLKLMLNAGYLGRFYLPQPKVEAMYDSSISAAGEGKWITVTGGEGNAVPPASSN